MEYRFLTHEFTTGGAAGVALVLLPRVLPAERGVRVADSRVDLQDAIIPA